MKSRISITLTSAALRGIKDHLADFRSRSDFIEAAVDYFIAHLERKEAKRRDLEILNAEAEDVLRYQVAQA